MSRHTYGDSMKMRETPGLRIVACESPALERRGLGPGRGENPIFVLVCGEILVWAESREGLDVVYGLVDGVKGEEKERKRAERARDEVESGHLKCDASLHFLT